MPKKILLLDVSHLFFRAFFAIPKNLTDAEGNVINAIYGVSSILLTLIESEKPVYIFGAKDEKGPTKRHEAFPEYKGHRPPMPEELVSQLPKITTIFEAFDIPCFSQTEFEADDIMATIAEEYRGNSEFEIEIVSADHDLFQLAGENVFNGVPQSGGKPPIHLDRDGVFEKIGVYPEQVPDYKGMAGDSSDNLKGVQGIGPKGAARLLQEYKTLENIFENIENIKGAQQQKLKDDKDSALLTKQLATLHRDIELENFELEAGNVENISQEKLDQFFRKYNFHSLLNRLPRVFSPEKITEEDKAVEALWEELEEVKKTKLSDVKKKDDGEDDQMALF